MRKKNEEINDLKKHPMNSALKSVVVDSTRKGRTSNDRGSPSPPKKRRLPKSNSDAEVNHAISSNVDNVKKNNTVNQPLAKSKNKNGVNSTTD